MNEIELVKAFKEMYIIDDYGTISRISDCSYRDFVSKPNPGKDMCQMKIRDMPTRNIAYVLHYGKLPHGRVVYNDGNRSNHRKENLRVVSREIFMKALSTAMSMFVEKKDKSFSFSCPKDLKTELARIGIETIGLPNIITTIHNSNLGRVQKDRAIKTVREIYIKKGDI